MQCMYWNMYNCKTKNIFWFNDQTLHKDCDLTIENWDGGLGSGVIKKSAFCAFDFADYYIFMYIISVGCFFGQAFFWGDCLSACCVFELLSFLFYPFSLDAWYHIFFWKGMDCDCTRLKNRPDDYGWQLVPPRYKWIIPSGKLTVRPWKSPFFGGN
jgi:hypothetical protein